MVSGQLVFKKAFGIDLMPMDMIMWFSELGTGSFTVQKRNRTFTITAGQVGVDEKEKRAISSFKHADERDLRFISEIPTLNLSTDVQLEIPEGIQDDLFGSADQFVRPFIQPAFVALQHLVEAYRDAKYTISRGTSRWTVEKGIFVQEIPLKTFTRYLFYSLTVGDRMFIGAFSEGDSFTTMPSDPTIHRLMTATLSTEAIPLERVLMVRAWDNFFDGDFRSAVVEAVTVIEISLSVIITRLLKANGVSESCALRFIDETSKRLLVPIFFGLFGMESEEWREGVVKTLEVRNALVHGKQRYASHSVAKSAVEYAEQFLILSEESVKAPQLGGTSPQ